MRIRKLKPRLKRPCRKCGYMFLPISKGNKVCMFCKYENYVRGLKKTDGSK